VENDMEAEFLMTSNDGSSLCGDEELSWWFLTHSNGIGSGPNSKWEVQSPTLQGENQGLALVGCDWQCSYWRHCFMSKDFHQGETYGLWLGDDNACAPFPLKASLLEKLDF
jgi:hypothetical protein